MAALDTLRPVGLVPVAQQGLAAELWQRFRAEAARLAWDWYHTQPPASRLFTVRVTVPVRVRMPIIKKRWTVHVPLRITVTTADAAKAIHAILGPDPRARAAAEQTISQVEVEVDEEVT
jgi:hypothetical protein